MKRGRPARCAFALVALAAVPAAPTLAAEADDDRTGRAAPAPAISETWVIEIPPEAGVIIDDQPTAPADVEGRLLACLGMPGCQAFWPEGGGVVLILGFEPQPP